MNNFGRTLTNDLSERSYLAWLRFVCCLFAIVLFNGCATQKYVQIRSNPFNPLTEKLNLTSRSGPEVTTRTMSLLRHYALLDAYHKDPKACLTQLQEVATDEKGAEKTYAIAELAYIVGKKAEARQQEGDALDMYTVAVSNAYLYLFCPDLDSSRNPYDPQFRGACDLYNASLEATLRLVIDQGNLRPGNSYRIKSTNKNYDVRVISKGSWKDSDFADLRFCSDFKVNGFDTSNLSYGIGVPMIGVRRPNTEENPTEKYYPEGLSFPALLRVTSPTLEASRNSQHRHPCVLELHDPLDTTDIQLNSRLVPLQSDLSTPLAYFLDNPKFREQTNSTLGLRDPSRTEKLRGIYMVEPFDPNRVPVVMVHGLWSSPLTWMPMFNDLRSFQELRRNYQFWFYQYPTGQPFWVSATQMRSDLHELRQTLDPARQYPVLDNIVLVGHSMGGLVSRMQTIESGDEFWKILSDKPFETIKGDESELQRIAAALYFHPNPSIKRVVTIGTPHRGSDYANDATRWLGRAIIKLPTSITDIGNSIIRQNPDTFRNTDLLTTNTSIDSLSPESPIFPTMLRAPKAPWVKYHNIVGVVEKNSWLSSSSAPSDGIVGVESAMMDDVSSEIMVESKHQEIHLKPRAILEVRRVLVEHLRELTQYPQLSSLLDIPDAWKVPSNAGTRNYVTTNLHPQQAPAEVVPAAAFEPLPFPEKKSSRLLAIPMKPKSSL